MKDELRRSLEHAFDDNNLIHAVLNWDDVTPEFIQAGILAEQRRIRDRLELLTEQGRGVLALLLVQLGNDTLPAGDLTKLVDDVKDALEKGATP